MSVVWNISEGFAQGSDRAFARYLYVSRGSAAEARDQLLHAYEHGCITEQQLRVTDAIGEEVAKMLTGLIRYLRRENRKVRW